MSTDERKDFTVKVLKLVDRWWAMHRRINAAESGTHSSIRVCDEWHGSAGREAFVLWALDNGFSPELVLDREKNHLGYSPENCRWITNQENVAKEHRTVEYQGLLYTQTELVDKFAHASVSLRCFRGRLKLNWPLEEALTRPACRDAWARGMRS